MFERVREREQTRERENTCVHCGCVIGGVYVCMYVSMAHEHKHGQNKQKEKKNVFTGVLYQ